MRDVERAQQYHSLRDVKAARPALDPSTPITVADFECLVGAITFPQADWVECQLVRRSTATVCGAKHGVGFIARRKDGREGFIGHVCARRHLADYVTLAAEISRVSRELKIENLVGRIQKRLDDSGFRSRLDAADVRCSELRSRIRRNRDRWPSAVLKRLMDMAKTGNSAIALQVCYPEKDENGREKPVWKSVRWRTIAAVGAIDPEPVLELARRLQATRLALAEAIPSRDLKIKILSAWVTKLEDLEACEAQLNARDEALDRFEQVDNLKLLTWTVRQDHLQLSVVQEVLRTSMDGAPTENQVTETWRRWNREVRDAHGGNNVRIA